MNGIKPNNKIGSENNSSLNKFRLLIFILLNIRVEDEETCVFDVTPVKSSSIFLEIGPIKGADRIIIRCLNTINPIDIKIIPLNILLIVLIVSLPKSQLQKLEIYKPITSEKLIEINTILKKTTTLISIGIIKNLQSFNLEMTS